MFVLALPWILLILLIILIFLLYCKKWIYSLVIIISCIAVNWFSECIPFHLWSIKEPSGKRILKVMSFNIDGASEDIVGRASSIVEIIEKQAADIVFIAEFSEEKLKYVDSLLTCIYSYSTCIGGSAHYFYSKYPLGKQFKIDDGEKKQGVFKCSVSIGNDSIILYGCHLTSNNYTYNMKYITPDSINSHQDLKVYLKDIRYAYSLREQQTKAIVRNLTANNNPIIVLGDLNDVGGSAAIQTLEKAGLKDAWWKGGLGYGATIHKPLPYRIDHILYSNEFQLKKVNVVSSEGLSDHDALCAEFYY